MGGDERGGENGWGKDMRTDMGKGGEEEGGMGLGER